MSDILCLVPNADGSIVIDADGVAVGAISDTQHGDRAGGSLHAAATPTVNGFMSAADKTKLDGIDLPKTNTAAVLPTASDDNTGGYSIGSVWYCTIQKSAYVCLDASTGAAVWRPISVIARNGLPGPTADINAGYSVGDLFLSIDNCSMFVCMNNSAGAAIWARASVGIGDSPSDPGAGDDAADGFHTGALWYNRTSGVWWICTDATFGAAVWRTLHGDQPGGSLHALTDSSDAGFQPQSNRAATAAPGAADDSAAGYEVGSYWVDTTADEAYICVDASAGAAVWNSMSGGGGAHGDQPGGTLHAVATTSVNGFMSATDKTKLDGIEAGADVTDAANVKLAIESGIQPSGVWSTRKWHTDSFAINTGANPNNSKVAYTLALPVGYGFFFKIWVVARNTATGAQAGWEHRFMVKRLTASSPVLINAAVPEGTNNTDSTNLSMTAAMNGANFEITVAQTDGSNNAWMGIVERITVAS